VVELNLDLNCKQKFEKLKKNVGEENREEQTISSH